MKAIDELAAYPLGRIEQSLLELLDDDESPVRVEAARVLVAKRSHRVLPRLRSWLSDPDGFLRATALKLMAAIGGKAALQEAVKALRDMDPQVRRTAVESIGKLGATSAISGLLSALGDDDWQVRAAAASAMGSVTDPRAVIGLIGVLGESRAEVRRAAVASLGRIGDPKAAQAVLRALLDSDKAVRLAAVKALGNLHAPQVVQVLVNRALRSADRSERLAALNALGRLRSPSAASALVSLLSLVRREQRPVVARLLSESGKVATKYIVARLESSNTSSPEARLLVRVLGEIQDPMSAAMLVQELGKGRVSPSLVLSSLSRCADWHAVPSLVSLALSPEADEARISMVVAALERAADGRSRVEVLRLFRSCRLCSEIDRLKLVTILGRIRAGQAFRDILDMARRGSLRMRRAALEALGSFADRRAAPILLKILRDGPHALRFAAADAAVHCLGSKELGVLVGMSRDPGLGMQSRAASVRIAGLLIRRLGAAIGPVLPVFSSLARGPLPLSLAAVDALGSTRSPKALELLVKLAFDPGRPRSLRCRAVEMLGAFQTSGLVSRLAHLVRTRADCAAQAAWVLGKIGKGQAGRRLVRRLLASADEVHVRRNLTASLARLAVLKDRGVLLGLLRDRDWVVRVNALAGLARLGPRYAGVTKQAVRRVIDNVGWAGLEQSVLISASKLGVSLPSVDARYRREEIADTHGDWIVVLVTGEDGRPRQGAEYLVGCGDGIMRSGRLGIDGVIHEERVPVGSCRLFIRE